MGTPNSRVHGYSLRRSLEDQGVTTEEAMRGHIAHVFSHAIDITRYRVPDPTYPNRIPA